MIKKYNKDDFLEGKESEETFKEYYKKDENQYTPTDYHKIPSRY